ncbi:glycoside hydrolase family 43 protein [Streptomyces griseorubiginosus]|uniref:glycoside hydrolase family 43 protein n=1 Tax=Streptomyces griseorubiginosus TaxID=67304 RepID=UPI003452EAED
MPTFSNPVLPGSRPDPSICRVGADYYLVTSSFAYFPGLPVHHSRDLVDWTPLGHVVDRPSQVSLTGLDVSDGLWAATIRHHEGTFYVVVTLARGRRGSTTHLFTASDPAGPWSDPVALDALDAEGIDPSLFFDDDGRCWFTACRDAAEPEVTGPGELWMRELDLHRQELTGPTYALWYGAVRGAWVEAPHLYKRDGVYHLIAAEGGTEHHHAVTAARAESVTGPYTTDPRSPLLTHRHRGAAEPVHNVGHADLVDTPAGETWAVGLSERLPAGVAAPPAQDGRPVRDDFAGPALGPEWTGLRGPTDHLVFPLPGEGGLSIRLSPEPLTSTGTPAFVARPQQHLRMRAAALVRLTAPAPGQEAGLVVFQNERRHATLALTVDGDGTRQAVLTAVDAGISTRLGAVPVTGTEVVLAVDGDEAAYAFHVEDGARSTVGSVERPFFSTERAGGFVGVHLGLYGTSGTGEGEAHVRWFEYVPDRD